MPSLLSGVAGSSWQRSSGLAAGNPIMWSDVSPLALQVRPTSLGPRVGKFRRAIIDVTVDSGGAPLGACNVRAVRKSNDVKVDQTVSDGAGNYELSVYDDGPFYCDADKPGAPNVSGITDNTLTGV